MFRKYIILMQCGAVHFGGGLTADLGGAVLFTGDFYKNDAADPDPDTLWELFSRVQLEF